MHNCNKSTTPLEETSIPKYYQILWVGWDRGLEEACSLSCSVDALFVDINYTICDYKEELLEEVLRSMEKFYRCKDIVYDILPPKIVQLYWTSDLRKYKRGKDENRNRQIKTANSIKFNNGFELHRKVFEATDYGRISLGVASATCDLFY